MKHLLLNKIGVLYFVLFYNIVVCAQDKSLLISSLQYIDRPAVVSYLDSNNIIPRNNYGCMIGIEKRFNFKKNLDIIFGTNLGHNRTVFWYSSDFTSFRFSIDEIRFLGVFSGIAATKDISDKFSLQFILKSGIAFFQNRNRELLDFDPSKFQDELNSGDLNAVNIINTSHQVNQDQFTHFLFNPALNIGYTFLEKKIKVFLGFNYLLIPTRILSGEIEYFLQTIDMVRSENYTYSNSIRASGISIGVEYFINKKKKKKPSRVLEESTAM